MQIDAKKCRIFMVCIGLQSFFVLVHTTEMAKINNILKNKNKKKMKIVAMHRKI